MSTQYSYLSEYNAAMYPGNAYPVNNGFVQSSAPGFAFKKRFERVDWKRIASVDVDAISRNVDFNALQDNIMNVTFCNIESEIDMTMVDPNFIKMFKLAQLTIEYLLHSQDYLSDMVAALENKMRKIIDEHDETKKLIENMKDELTQTKKESHKRKKMIIAQQQIIQAGTDSYNKCPFCTKAFVNGTFLQSHLLRRHPDCVGSFNSMATPQVPQSVQPPQALSTTPPTQPQIIQSAATLSLDVKQLEKELQEIKAQLVEERNATNREKDEGILREQKLQAKMKELLEKNEESHKQEIVHITETFTQELRETSEKYERAQAMLADLQYKVGHGSNLGDIQDDNETERELQQKQREEKLHSNIQTTVEEIHLSHKSHLSTEQQHKEQIERHKAKQKEEEERKRKEKEKEQLLKAAQHKAASTQQEATPGVGSTMYDDEDDEDDEDNYDDDHDHDHDDADNGSEDELTVTQKTDEQTTDFGTTSYSTTRVTGTLSMGHFGTSLSMTEPPSERLLEAKRRNPHLLDQFHKEIYFTLEQELRKRGIPEDAKGLPDKVYEAKIQLLKNERQKLAMRYRNIFDIRQSYLDLIEGQARIILDEQRKQQVVLRPASEPRDACSPNTSDRRSAPGKRPSTSVPQRSEAPDKSVQAKHAPVPAPRATSPTGRHHPSSHVPQTRSSVGSSMATTVTSSTWDDEDEDEDEDEEENADVDKRDGERIARYSATRTSNIHRPTKNTRFMDSESSKEEDEDEYEEDDEDDDNWDELSGFDSMEPSPRKTPRSTVPAARSLSPTVRPTGKKVAQLTQSIALQLSQRKSGKKLAGAVDVMKRDNNERKSDGDEDDEESLVSVTSYEDEKVSGPRPMSRRGVTSLTRSTVTDDTNTYGTSVWGASSKGVSSIQPSVNNTSTAKTSDAADSDSWDVENTDP